MRPLTDLNVADRRVLVRVDFNVPLTDTLEVADDLRIAAALPTLRYLLDKGAALVLVSHLGRPKGKPEAKYSLRPVQHRLAELLGRPVLFVPTCIGPEAEAVTDHLHPGDVVLLENLRFHPEEEKGDVGFAAALARHAEVYVNDAFGAAHRPHSSIYQLPGQFQETAAGMLLAAEVANAERVLAHAERPFVAVIGGAKVSDKIAVIENLLPRVSTLIIGGGMAYTFIQAQGGQVGASLVEADKLDTARSILAAAAAAGVTVLLPEDSVVADRFAADAATQVMPSAAITSGWMGLDIGPAAVAAAQQAIASAKTVLWNGPMGVFELAPFAAGTLAIGRALADCTAAGGYTLVGGGDSAAAVRQMGLSDRVSYVSTGGGALLEFLEGKTLPGVAVLTQRA